MRASGCVPACHATIKEQEKERISNLFHAVLVVEALDDVVHPVLTRGSGSRDQVEDIRESDGIGAVVNIDISHYQAQNGAVESRLREQNARLVASSAREPLQQMRNDGLTTLELLAFEGQHADILEEAKKCLPICIEKVVEVGAKRLSNFVVTGHISKRLQERKEKSSRVCEVCAFLHSKEIGA